MNRWSALALLVALAGALALRAPQLDARPFHNDEAVNALKLAELWQHGRYAYDPDEYHGPTLHYFSLPFLWLSGAKDPGQLTEATLRLAPVAFGTGLILLLLLFADGLGPQAIIWSSFLLAVSPAMVFYSRYFIHEMLLMFFTALTLGASLRYAQTRLSRWAVVAGVGVGLMFATKETFVLALAAMALAAGATRVVGRASSPAAADCNRDGRGDDRKQDACATAFRHAALAILAAFIVWIVLFSSFFTNWPGLADSLRTYLPWLKRAGGHSPHIHPWNFYLERLAWFHPAKGPAWSEGVILVLALVGAGVSLGGTKSPLHRFLAFYTIILTVAYSVISYKTPWCLLSFLFGMILLAGIGAAALVDFCRTRLSRVMVITLLAAGLLQLGWQAARASFDYPRADFIYSADRRNPYVYAQTVPDVLNLVQKMEALAHVEPRGHDRVVKVIAPGSDYWPLPWYLRRFTRVGWYDKLPDDPFAPVIIVSAKLNAALDERSGKKWVMVGMSELRPGNFLELYVELELWRKFLELSKMESKASGE